MIAPMDRIEIVCLRAILEQVTLFLQLQGILHVEEVPLTVEAAPGFLHRAHLNDEQQTRATALESVRQMLNEITPLLTEKPSADAVRAANRTLCDQSPEAWRAVAEGWHHEFRALTRQKVAGQDRLEVLRNYQHVLEAVAPVMQGRDVQLGKGARALVLQGDVKRALERLDSKLARHLNKDYQMIKQVTSRRHAVALILYKEAQDGLVARVLDEERIIPIDVRGDEFEGSTVSQMLPRLADAMQKQQDELVTVGQQIDRFSREHGAGVVALDGLTFDALSQLNVVNRFAHSEMIGVIQGWAPSETFNELKARLHKEFPGQIEIDRLHVAHDDYGHVPTLLKNKAWAKPFEALLTLFRPPTYGTYDPTLLVGVSFILFYGFILGDVAYGLAVLALSHLLRKTLGHIPLADHAGKVGYYMAISSIIFGVLYGEYAGDFGEKAFGLQPLWFHRAHETSRLLLYGILFGVVHIPLALMLGIWQDYKHQHMHHAQEKLGLLLGLTALGIFICKFMGVAAFAHPVVGWLSLAIFLVAVVLLVVTVKAMALIQILEIISLFGNVMSYSRLMALGVASIAIADIANQMGRDLPYVIGIPVAIVIHFLNVGIGIFSPTLHSLRLNYVEFLPKFFSAQGKVYQPFRKEKSC